MSYTLSHGKALDVTGVGLDATDLGPIGSGPVDPRAWFAPHDDRPIELEIGSGKGAFLLRQATAQPLVNYVSIEYARAFWRYTADRMRRHGLSNVKLVYVEAGAFVRQYCPGHVFRTVHIYFPDPWPKKRHHKRRLIQAPFLEHLHRVLTHTRDATVRITTDHAEYFKWMFEASAPVSALFDREPYEPDTSAPTGELAGTNFERKYRDQGRPFYAMVLRKRV